MSAGARSATCPATRRAHSDALLSSPDVAAPPADARVCPVPSPAREPTSPTSTAPSSHRRRRAPAARSTADAAVLSPCSLRHCRFLHPPRDAGVATTRRSSSQSRRIGLSTRQHLSCSAAKLLGSLTRQRHASHCFRGLHFVVPPWVQFHVGKAQCWSQILGPRCRIAVKMDRKYGQWSRTDFLADKRRWYSGAPKRRADDGPIAG